MSYDVGHRHSSDMALLWLWHRPVATAPIRPLAWEPSYAMGLALKSNIYGYYRSYRCGTTGSTVSLWQQGCGFDP